VSACGSSSAAKSDAQQASDALTAGLQAQGQGHTQEAINDYNTVLKHDSKNKYAYYNLGVIDQGAGRNDSAEKDYRNALQIDPEFVSALFNLAIIRTVPSPSEAESLYRHVIANDSANAAAHLNLGFVLRTEGRQAEGTTELQTAVRLDPQLASRVPDLNASPSPSPHR
jgi:tetratricopeptide (TPR) repeat protein